MAFIQNITADNGLPVAGAYLRVERWRAITKTRICFDLCGYVDASSPMAVFNQVRECDFDPNGPNPAAQAYAHLKAHPEFAGSVDA